MERCRSRKIGVGSELRQISSCTVFSRKGVAAVRRARRIDVCTETHTITRVPEKFAKREGPNIPRAPLVRSQGAPQRKEPRHELLEHGARSPRGSGAGQSGSDRKRVRRPMGPLSKRNPRRWSFEGLISLCLFLARRAYASAPKRKQVQVDGRSWGLCWQPSEMCCATCWLSAEQTRRMGGAWTVPLRSGRYDTAGGEVIGKNPRRGVCSEEQCRPHVLERCRPCGTCPATNRRGLFHFTAVVVAVVERKGAPSVGKPPEEEKGLWARWKAKTTSERLEERCNNSKSSFRRRHL